MSRKPAKNLQTRQNREYKQKIYALCKRASIGDPLAIINLDSELEKNTLAIWAVKHWMKIKRIPLTVSEPLSPEKQALRDRIQSRGFGDGAHVPGSNIRKYGKNKRRK